MVLYSRHGHHALRLDFGRVLLILLVLGSLVLVVGVQPIPTAKAQGTGPELFIQPASHALGAPSSLVRLNVSVANMATFAGWDIYVKTNNNVLSPTGINLGTFMPAGFTSINCINGAGTSCDANDGPGVAHSSFASFGFAAGSGTLFTVNYTAVAGPGTVVRFPETITGNGNGGLNSLFDTSGNNVTGVPEINGNYGVVDTTSSSVSCLPSTTAVGSLTTCTITVTDTSLPPSAPTGKANFTSNGSGTFTGSPCTLTGSTSPTSCQVTYSPLSLGSGAQIINATYTGDLGHMGSTAKTTLTITGSPITTTLSSTSIVVGGSAYDTALMATSFFTGTVTYDLFSTGDCSGTSTVVSTVTIVSGSVPNSALHTFTSAGLAGWTAVYSGDTNNRGATSACEPLTINKASPTVSTSLVSTIINVAGSTNDTAAVVNGFQASGTMTYSFFSGLACSGTSTHVGNPALVTNGVVKNSTAQAFSAAGYYSWNAAYSGDSNNNAATSPCEPLVVIIPGANFGATLSSNSFNVGDKVVINVSVVNTSPISESFTVEVKWGALTVAHQDNVPFSPGQSQSLTLTWDTSQYAAGTMNLTIAVPQTGTIQNVGPLTLNSGSQSFLAVGLPLYVGVGVVVVAVLAAVVWLMRRRSPTRQSATL
jgi:hypothetical protein